MNSTFVRSGLVAVVLVTVCGLSGCGALGGGGAGGSGAPLPAASTTVATPAAAVFKSEFTSDGTFQSHTTLPQAPGLDFVYTLYPTKATPRTNEWYPSGDKYFSFTFQAYDLNQPVRAAFATKRQVWLSHITVTSTTTTNDGGAPEHPYALDAVAARRTFDPEPLTSVHGMLVTSPKGAFELRNQKIGTVSADTIGVTLTFKATISIETAPGSGHYLEEKVTQQVPIAIFTSTKATVASAIPIDAN